MSEFSFSKAINLSHRTSHIKEISTSSPTFLVAEVGLNHNADIKIAKDLITAAKDSGADAVKFQSYTTEKFINKKAPRVENLFHIFKQYELSLANHATLKEFSDKKELLFFSTPLSLDWVDLLEDLEVCAYKVASGDLTNIRLLDKIIQKNKPIFMSTGAALFRTIEKSVACFKKHDFFDLIILHCVSLYPTPWEKINLNRMKQIKKKIRVISGFSDHTIGTNAAEYAVLMGGCVIEKHFTLNKSLPGPDHHLSATPDELLTIRKKIDIAFEIRESFQENSWPEEFAGDYFGKRSLYNIKGEMVPMRPRQNNLPKDYE